MVPHSAPATGASQLWPGLGMIAGEPASVSVGRGTSVDVLVGVSVGVDVLVAVGVGVLVGVDVGVGVSVSVAVGVDVGVAVGVAVGVLVVVGVGNAVAAMVFVTATIGGTSATGGAGLRSRFTMSKIVPPMISTVKPIAATVIRS